MRRYLVACVIALSACAQVPTTQPPAPTEPAAQPAPAPQPAPETPPGAEPAPVPPSGDVQQAPLPEPGAREEARVGEMPQVPLPGAPGAPRAVPGGAVALVLPAQTTVFARAAEAVRLGFFAAHAAAGSKTPIQVIEIDDDAQQLFQALSAARSRGVQVAVGPLTRSLVNALVDSGRIEMPTLTLNYPENDGAAPPTLIAFGLSIEQEARRLVRAALGEFVGLRPGATTRPRFVIVSGGSALARRVANAYRDALGDAGERAMIVEPTFDAAGLEALAAQFADPANRFEAAFLALDAREAALARPRLPRNLLLFATSQVYIGDAEGAALAHDLVGVRFADMPWLLEPDHPAVMIYARPDAPMSAELQRLYAFGIDAYRIVQAWMETNFDPAAAFEIDGVTGLLRVDRRRGPRVERLPSFAVFRGGKAERLELGQ